MRGQPRKKANCHSADDWKFDWDLIISREIRQTMMQLSVHKFECLDSLKCNIKITTRYICLIYSNTIHRNNDWRNPLYYLQSTDLESLDSFLQISSYIHFWQSQTCISYGFFDPQSTFMQPPVQPPCTPTSPVVKPRPSPNVHHQGELHPF